LVEYLCNHKWFMNTPSRTTRIERDPMYNLERELKIRGFSRKTIKAYLHYNRKFLNFLQEKAQRKLPMKTLKDIWSIWLTNKFLTQL
jgi:orotate phosphoribosyltransferase-like protein